MLDKKQTQELIKEIIEAFIKRDISIREAEKILSYVRDELIQVKVQPYIDEID